jgi:predicted Rdx family selenoprotein
LKELSGASVDGAPGRRSSFEVTLNDKLIFSKLSQKGFPEFPVVVEECIKASKGVETSQVNDVAKSECIIL